MNVDTMRRIDHWAGVPLCAAATLLVRLRDWFRPRAGAAGAADPVRRTVGNGQRPSLPSRRCARRALSLSAELFFVIFARNAGSLDLFGTFPPRMSSPSPTTSLFALARDTLGFLRVVPAQGHRHGRRSGTVLALHRAAEPDFRGADRRVGFYRFHNEGLYRGEMLTHRVAYNPHIHIAKNFIALIDALFAPAPTVPYSKTLIGDDQLNVALPPPGARGARAHARRASARWCRSIRLASASF